MRPRHRARDARRQRRRGRPHPQPEDRPQSGPGRRRLGHRHGAARGDVHGPPLGRFMNHNLAEYHVPVNADVSGIDVIFVDEHDDASTRSARRAGRDRHRRRRGRDRECRLSRDGQAHRRDLPITLDKLAID